MTKQIRILTLLLAISSIFTACKFEEPDLFEKSAAERLILAKERYYQALLSSPNGWVMDYFPTEDQKGYTFLVKFNENTSAVFAAKNELTNNAYATDTCVFEIIGDNGPVLTFNLAGDNLYKVGIFHIFTNPEGGYYGQGVGYGGDYEFMTISATPEKIMLKGKKRGVYIELRRLPESQDWKDYFNQLDAMNNLLFNRYVSQILMSVEDSVYTLNNGISHIFVAVPQGGDPITENSQIPFIVTDKGILFSKTVTYNNTAFREFHLSDDKNELICVDEGVNAKITGPDILNFYFSSTDAYNLRWVMSSGEEYMSPTVQAIYDRIVQAFLKIDKNAPLNQIAFRNTQRDSNLIYIDNKKNQYGSLLFDREQLSEGVKYQYKNTFSSDRADNGKAFYTNLDGVADLTVLASSSFKIEYASSKLNPIRVKLTDISNPNVWFVLNVQ